MNLINSCFVAIALNFSLAGCVADENSEMWTTFGEGEDRERFANCFLISYPNGFTIDPASGISPSPNLGDSPIPEENFHTLILHDDKDSLEVRASSYGFLTKEFYTSRGFASPREVILTDFFRNAMITKIDRLQDFELFYSESDSSVVAVYLDRNAKWGSCYQSLIFSVSNGATVEDYAEVIQRIVAEFIPGFARPNF